MYDQKSLSNLILLNNFKNVLSLNYGNSVYIKDISDVEGTQEAYLSIYLEAIKP